MQAVKDRCRHLNNKIQTIVNCQIHATEHEFNGIRASIGADITSGWKEKTYDERKSGNHLFSQYLQPL
jgi:hypothetical protein